MPTVAKRTKRVVLAVLFSFDVEKACGDTDRQRGSDQEDATEEQSAKPSMRTMP